MRVSLQQALSIADEADDRYGVVLERGNLELGLYAPVGTDPQRPHERRELYIVACGSATFTEAGRDVAVVAGDALHVTAHVEHRFTDLSDDFAAWVVFDRSPTSRLVPEGVRVPETFDHARFRLRPLGPEHNARDYAAWTTSVEHIRATPGFVGGDWPRAMTADENLADLRMHASHFATRAGFTYTVLSPDGPLQDADVIGCVYLYPSARADRLAEVTSWVRADAADLDAPLAETVLSWLTSDAWPFDTSQIEHHPRGA